LAEVFERGAALLSTTDETLVYQAPNNDDRDRAITLSCTAANSDSATEVGVTLKVTTAADALVYRSAVQIPVKPKSAIELLPNRKVLKRGDKVKMQATLANRLEVAVDVLEITPNV
jgi:hypothetical protein